MDPDGPLQLSLFDQQDLAEIRHPDFPGERLIACMNPLLRAERARKREDLLQATERQLDKIVAAVSRPRRPLTGAHKIGERLGRVIHSYKMAKHFETQITDTSFHYRRKTDSIKAEARLDGIYVIRTSVDSQSLDAAHAVIAYKRLATVERAFRCLKTVDLHVRPIYHRLGHRVRHTSSCACSLTMWSGTCAVGSPPCCSLMTIPMPLPTNAPRPCVHPNPPIAPNAKPAPAVPLTTSSPCITSEACSITSPPSHRTR